MPYCADLHLHSIDFSGDAVDTMEDMCKGAIAKGLQMICITDHVDFNPHYDDSIPFDPQRYDDAIARMRDRYGDRIKIQKGIEIGEPHIYQKEYEKILKGEYDLVIASIHYINIDMGFHWTGNGGKNIFVYGVGRIWRRYYEDLAALTKLGGFDVLGHFDNPKRYLMCEGEEEELINESLTALVQNGSILEINTSSLRKGYPETCPNRKILELYRRAGGTRLILGSDAHAATDIAAGFEHGIGLAKETGLQLGYFEKRQFYPFAQMTYEEIEVGKITLER